MLLKKLKALVKQGESETLEFKETTGRLTDSMRTICAFLNQEGGTILFGVSDKGKIVGQEISDKTYRDIANALTQINPQADVKVDRSALGSDKYVIVLIVKEGKYKPYTYDGRYYIRTQSTTHQMPIEERTRLHQESSYHSWDSLATDKCSMTDLDKKRINEVAKMALAEGRLPKSAQNSSAPELLLKLGLLKNKSLTNAAMLLFCKADKLPSFSFQMMLARFEGTDKSVFLDRKDLHGNLFDVVEDAMKFLRFTLPISGRVPQDSLYRIDTPAIPFEALREALLNALIHRDYTVVGSSIYVAVYNDRVQITNPGKLPKGITLRELTKTHESVQRNPLIANIFYICGMIERWGRGTLKMIDLCKQAGNPLPKFEESSAGFSVTFPLKEPLRQFAGISAQQHSILMDLTDRQREILVILRYGPLSREKIIEKMKNPLADRTVQKDLAVLKKINLILQKGKGKLIKWELAE